MTHPMIVHDAKEFAGVFYDQKRSGKFRTTWPSQMGFVNANWPNFVVHVRSAYAEMLARPNTPQDQKDKIYAALIDDAKVNRSDGADSPLQLTPNTQAFEGDRRANAKVDEDYGKHEANTLHIAKRMLLGSTGR
jgi:hypothetical protein